MAEWSDVIDTAVKIIGGGFVGALTSGVITYFITKENHKHDLKKAQLAYAHDVHKSQVTYKREMIIEIIKQIESFGARQRVLWRQTSEILKWQENESAAPEENFSKWLELYRNVDLQDLSGAEAKLILLGESESASGVRDYGTGCVALLNKIDIDEGKIINVSPDEWDEFYNRMTELRHRIYKMLGSSLGSSTNHLNFDIEALKLEEKS